MASAPPTDTEQSAAEEEARAPAAPPEVRPEEFTQGTAASPWQSALPEEAVDALRMPLDPNRIRTRKGRGGGQFEYLAGHDVKRRANEIFGFGNWGSRLLRVEETAAVEVQNDKGTGGWHVSYMAVVEVEVRGCLPFSDVGYGDGVEYGAAALAQARELATKEAATDALKRAFTAWGDQFGLILYAKDDEKKRIDRERNAGESLPVVRRDTAVNVPKNWAECIARFAAMTGVPYGEEEAQEWLRQAVVAKFEKPSLKDLTTVQRTEAITYFKSTVLALEEQGHDLEFASGVRATIAGVFKEKWKVDVEGPAWRLDPTEESRPVHASDKPDDEAAVAAAGVSADDIPFGEKGGA